MNCEEFNGKVVLVTGSSKGIGASIARAFAINGAKVAIHGRDKDALAAVEAGIINSGGTAKAFMCELTSFKEIELMRTGIESAFGAVEILVANAGGNLTPPAILEEIPEDGWRKTIDLNLTGTFLTAKSFLPKMKERKSGNIIMITSSAARMPNAQSPISYGAAKAGVIVMAQDLAAQAGPFGIRVNCIAPATILTEKNLLQIPANKMEMIINLHALKRLGTPEDIANAALFLASEQSAWITGVTLDVAGGYVMK